VEEGLDLLDALDVHEGEAMDAEETVRVELRLEPRHRLADEVLLAPAVEPQVVARRLHPVDLVDLDEHEAAAGLDEEALHVALLSRAEVLDERGEPIGEARLAAALEGLAR